MSQSTNTPDRELELKDLEKESQEQKQKIEMVKHEEEGWIEKRDQFNADNKKLWKEVKEYKAKRDELNGIIKGLKQERNGLYEGTKPLREELEMLRMKVNDFLGRTDRSESTTIKRIHELDWEIQTNPLTSTEEKAIIEQVKELEKQALLHKEASAVKNRILQVRTKLIDVREKANEVHRKITILAEQSQSYHEKMMLKIKETQQIKLQANEAHKKYLEFQLQIEELQTKYIEVVSRLRNINFTIKREQEEEASMRIDALVAVESEEALKKYKERKKITLGEFKMLKNKGLI